MAITCEQSQSACCSPAAEHSDVSYQPAYDVVQTETGLIIYADMPGCTRDSIEVTLLDGVLKVHGQVKPRAADAARSLISEYGVGDYSAQFRVGDKIDPDRVGADYRDGVLTLTLTRRAAHQPKRIPVTVGP